MGSLQGKCVVVVGRGGGIARAVALLARSEGARVVVAGRDSAALAAEYDGERIAAQTVDVTDDTSICTLADRVGPVDHLVSTVSARARGELADLDRAKLLLSFDTKVIGPMMLAKHFAPQLNQGASIVLFSRVNAISPGVIDTGAWDSLGAERQAGVLREDQCHEPGATRGTVDDVAEAVLFALTSTFMTGMTLKVDGGEPLI